MNIERFNLLMKGLKLWQQSKEWLSFLEFVEAYFKNRGIEHPIVVELGVAHNLQKKFYEEFLGAEHIGIDVAERCHPDILGDTHGEETTSKLKAKLNGRAINLLFIDAGHLYEEVKKDYQMYEPLTRNIVAFHDVLHNDSTHKEVQVRLLWEEIMRVENRYTKVLFSLKPSYMGLGVIVKE